MFDLDTFSKILDKINSTYDTMSDFAMKASLDRTYISKYINKKLNNPPSPEIIKKIANASNGITTYYELMEICGYIDLRIVFKLSKDNKESNLCWINKSELKESGFSIEDIDKIISLANSNIKDKNKEIAKILSKYPINILNEFYDKAIIQTKNLKILSPDFELEHFSETDDILQRAKIINSNLEKLNKLYENNFRYASYGGEDEELDEEDKEKIRAFVEFLKTQKKPKKNDNED